MAPVVLCDTSVLVAGMVEQHVHHSETLPIIEGILKGRFKGLISAHSLAECYSVLTTLRDLPPMPPSQAREVVEKNLLEAFQVIGLSVEDYRRALRLVSEPGLRGAAIYDALILQAALRGKVSVIITWDKRDFTRLAGGEIRVETPASFRASL